MRGVQAVAGDVGAEQGHRDGVEDTKFWSQCSLFVVGTMLLGPHDEEIRKLTLKLHFFLTVSYFMRQEVWSGRCKTLPYAFFL